jgi:excinuclease ABC subunit C
VYWFLSSVGSVLYVGKAKNLKNRISQYRQLNGLTSFKQRLVREAVEVRYQILRSELEAILVEAELIRKYQPHYNIALRDDKSPVYIVITNELFPRILTARRTDLEKPLLKNGTHFGPFQSAYMLRQVLRSIRSSFGWCSQAGKEFPTIEVWQKKISEGDTRLCFSAQVGICSGACSGEVSPKQYANMIRRLKLFLRGKTRAVQRELKKQIESAAREQNFELAALLKAQWDAIEHLVSEKYKLAPDVALPRLQDSFGHQAVLLLSKIIRDHFSLPMNWQAQRIEGYDVSNVQGRYATVSMVVFVNGQEAKQHYRIFHIRSKDTPDDYAMLQEALRRRQRHPEWGEPDLVLIDGGKGQLRMVNDVWQWENPVVSIGKRPDRLFLPKREERSALEIPVERLGAGGQLLQQIRDESHRFAKKHVHKRLEKRDILQ